jgi:hypothetical protein
MAQEEEEYKAMLNLGVTSLNEKAAGKELFA